MILSKQTTSNSSNSKYHLEPVGVAQHTVMRHINLAVSSSSDDQLSVFVNRNLVYNDSVLNFTSKVRLELGRIFEVLISTIKSLKLTQDYNGTYVAYLSGQLSHEDFLSEASKYSYSPAKELSIETIKDIKILFDTTKVEFSPSDIADIFKIDHDMSVAAIEQLEIPSVEK